MEPTKKQIKEALMEYQRERYECEESEIAASVQKLMDDEVAMAKFLNDVEMRLDLQTYLYQLDDSEKRDALLREPHECPQCQRWFLTIYPIRCCVDHGGEEATYPQYTKKKGKK